MIPFICSKRFISLFLHFEGQTKFLINLFVTLRPTKKKTLIKRNQETYVRYCSAYDSPYLIKTLS